MDEIKENMITRQLVAIAKKYFANYFENWKGYSDKCMRFQEE